VGVISAAPCTTITTVVTTTDTNAADNATTTTNATTTASAAARCYRMKGNRRRIQPYHLQNHINNIGNCFKTGKFGRNIEKPSALNSRFIAYRPLFFKIINKSRTKQ
jgi:hypothetical protein